jgi:hypothetical protein
VNKIIQQKLANRRRRIQRRLDKTDLRGCDQPMITARNIHYEIADRCRGIAVGGIGAIHTLARGQLGLWSFVASPAVPAPALIFPFLW